MKDAGSGMGRRLLNRLCTTNTESDNFRPVEAKVLLRAAGAAMRLHRARVQAGRPFHLCSARFLFTSASGAQHRIDNTRKGDRKMLVYANRETRTWYLFT